MKFFDELAKKLRRKGEYRTIKRYLISEFKKAKRDKEIKAELLLNYESAMRISCLPENVEGILRCDEDRCYGIWRLILNGGNSLKIDIFLSRNSGSMILHKEEDGMPHGIIHKIRIEYEYRKDDPYLANHRRTYIGTIEFDSSVGVKCISNNFNNSIDIGLINNLCDLICDSAINTLETIELGDKYEL